jgi:hypothetical protein
MLARKAVRIVPIDAAEKQAFCIISNALLND